MSRDGVAKVDGMKVQRMSGIDSTRWKRIGPGYEAGCRVAPDKLRRSLARIATMTGADLVLLLRSHHDGDRFVRIAGVDGPYGRADDLAAAATKFPAAVTAGVDSLSADASMIVHWLSQPDQGGFLLVLARRGDRPPFDSDALRSVMSSCEWLDDIVALWWDGQRSEVRAASLRAALSNGDTSIILLDSHGMIIEANAGAARLLRQGCGLVLHGAHIEAEHPDDDARLRKAVLDVTSASSSGRSLKPVQFSIRRGPGHHPLAVAVMRPHGLHAFQSDETDPVVLLQIVDPDADQSTTAQSFALYKLTPQETRLTEQLVAGRTISEAADRLHLSPASARTYLKRIFAKTGVNRQASLVRLVLNSRMPLYRPTHGALPWVLGASGLKPTKARPQFTSAIVDDDVQFEMSLLAPTQSTGRRGIRL